MFPYKDTKNKKLITLLKKKASELNLEKNKLDVMK